MISFLTLIIHLRDKGNAPTSVRISEVKRVVIGCLITPLISFLFSGHIKRTTLFYVIYLIKHLDVRRKHSRRIFVSLLGVCHVLCLSCFFFLLQFFFHYYYFIYFFISLIYLLLLLLFFRPCVNRFFSCWHQSPWTTPSCFSPRWQTFGIKDEDVSYLGPRTREVSQWLPRIRLL